jgi:predicted SAM-dependent methyltransferase
MSHVKLNLGCGDVRPAGWINTDSSLNANMQRIPLINKIIPKLFKTVSYSDPNLIYMDLNKPWRWPSESIDIVYGSHIFEHLTLQSAHIFLKEAMRTLKKGGVIRIVVPDLFKICKKYVNEYEGGNPLAWQHIMWAINMNREGQYPNVKGIKKWLAEWQGYPHQHKYMYDKYSMQQKLEPYGFRNVLHQEFGKSTYIDSIHEVEFGTEKYLSVYLEAIK